MRAVIQSPALPCSHPHSPHNAPNCPGPCGLSVDLHCRYLWLSGSHCGPPPRGWGSVRHPGGWHAAARSWRAGSHGTGQSTPARTTGQWMAEGYRRCVPGILNEIQLHPNTWDRVCFVVKINVYPSMPVVWGPAYCMHTRRE